VATAALALVAGGDDVRALTLGLAVAALQVSIGSLNDLVDHDRDRGLKPGKPIPAGLVDRGSAWLVVILGATTGIVLSILVSPAAALVAIPGPRSGMPTTCDSR
jgi:4-hydroxybenzoate polyprenyltransferase